MICHIEINVLNRIYQFKAPSYAHDQYTCSACAARVFGEHTPFLILRWFNREYDHHDRLHFAIQSIKAAFVGPAGSM